MICVQLQREILRLYAIHHSQRLVSRLTGVGRPSVATVVHRGCVRHSPENRVTQDSQYGHSVMENVERCPGCGAMVEMPCKACATVHNEPGVSCELVAGADDIGVGLVGEDRERYENLRVFRAEQMKKHGPINENWPSKVPAE